MRALILLATGLLLPMAWPGPVPAVLPLFAALIALVALLSPSTRFVALIAAGVFWTSTQVLQISSNRVATLNESILLSGQVVGLPSYRDDYQEFRFRPEQPQLLGLEPPTTLLVRWYRAGEKVSSGDSWRFTLRVRPPRGRVNFQGSDMEAWLFSERIAGLASVNGPAQLLGRYSHAGRFRPATWLSAYRQRLRDRLHTTLEQHPGLGLVLALSVADRSQLPTGIREAMVFTGTGHLLAISGMHIGMIALFAGWLTRLLATALNVHSRRLPPVLLAWLGALFAATVYAGLAGFATSTQRALIMLVTVAICCLLRRHVAPLQALLSALVVVLLADPVAPAAPGFWLSFGAVAVLISVFMPLRPAPAGFAALVRAQLGIVIVLLPLGLYWFQRMGAGGLVANLLAIPAVTLLTLPLTFLAALLTGFTGAVAEVPAFMAADSAHWLSRVLLALSVPAEQLSRRVPAPLAMSAVLATLGGLLVLGPARIQARYLGLLLWLPVLLLPPSRPSTDQLQLQVLDVGQGLAVLVSTSSSLLLYDTGPGLPGRWDLNRSVLQPAFARLGRQPDWVIVSHGDLDHAGAVTSLQAGSAIKHWLINDPGRSDHVAGCHDQRQWKWDGFRFQVLHPGPFLPYLGNNSSCVISIQASAYGILLPGDIEAVVESRLVQRGLGQHQLVIAPHHASTSSSSVGFLLATRPDIIISATGLDNRFGFPSEAVLERYRQHDIAHFNTAACGAIEVEISNNALTAVRSARRIRQTPWRWPAAASCP